MGGFISYFFSESYPTEATDVQQTEDSSQASSSPISEKEKSDLYIPQCTISETPRDTAGTKSIVSATGSFDHTNDVDKIYIYVISTGKQTEISIFPLEKISCLLQKACSQLNKKPENMSLIFQGEPLDPTKRVSDYPNLRSGKKVNLIRAS